MKTKTNMNFEVNNFTSYEDAKEWSDRNLLSCHPRLNLSGNLYGRLKVVEPAGSKVIGLSEQKRIHYICKCDCGNFCVVDRGKLHSGHTQSCGCKQQDNISKEIDLRKERCYSNIHKFFKESEQFQLLSEIPRGVGLWDFPIEVECLFCHKSFKRIIGKFLSSEYDCPNCPSTVGFTPDQPALLYILKVNGDEKGKFGISGSYTQRLSVIRNNNKDFEIVPYKFLYFEKGQEARDLETELKRVLTTDVIDGFGHPEESAFISDIEGYLVQKGYNLNQTIPQPYRLFERAKHLHKYFKSYGHYPNTMIQVEFEKVKEYFL